MMKCRSLDCNAYAAEGDFCPKCSDNWNDYCGFNKTTTSVVAPTALTKPAISKDTTSLSEKYPQYYKKVGDLREVDVYAVHHIFDIQDPSGAIQHASKKLLLSGVRTGGKSAMDDVKEARDTLTRWLQLNEAKYGSKS